MLNLCLEFFHSWFSHRFSIEFENQIRSVYVKLCLLPVIFQKQISEFQIPIWKFWKKLWILYFIRRQPFALIKVLKKRSIWIRWAANVFGICARKWRIYGVLYTFRPHIQIQLDPMLMKKCIRPKFKWIWIHLLNVPMYYPMIWSIRLQLIYKYAFSQHLLNVLLKHFWNSVLLFQGQHPNTYTITKSMAEQMTIQYHHKLPITIVRPSIVTCSLDEPFRGWVDNVNGITGIIMEIGNNNKLEIPLTLVNIFEGTTDNFFIFIFIWFDFFLQWKVEERWAALCATII